MWNKNLCKTIKKKSKLFLFRDKFGENPLKMVTDKFCEEKITHSFFAEKREIILTRPQFSFGN